MLLPDPPVSSSLPRSTTDPLAALQLVRDGTWFRRLGPGFTAWSRRAADLFAAAYVERPGERAFWRKLAGEGRELLQVGGTTALTEALLVSRPRSLTVVEPEFERVRLLQGVTDADLMETPVYIACCTFDRVAPIKADLVVCGQGLLAYVATPAQRLRLFRKAALHLRPGGIFALHVQAAAAFRAKARAAQRPVIVGGWSDAGERVLGRVWYEELRKDLYLQFLSVAVPRGEPPENFFLPVAAIDTLDLMEAAGAARLRLIRRWGGFAPPASPDDSPSDDEIYLFQRA